MQQVRVLVALSVVLLLLFEGSLYIYGGQPKLGRNERISHAIVNVTLYNDDVVGEQIRKLIFDRQHNLAALRQGRSMMG